MGDIKKPRKKYSQPAHPWQKDRMDEEKALLREFGLTTKKEVWKMVALLKKYTGQAKRLTPLSGPQVDLERKQLLDKLAAFGLLPESSNLSDVLTLTARDIMERRLQTQLVRKHYARTMKQARQMITHRHVMVGGKSVNVPSYMVRKDEEVSIGFNQKSPFVSEMHPERSQPEAVAVPTASADDAEEQQ